MKKMIATYRFQLSKDFQFNDVERQLPYLKELSVSHIYLSPVFEATPGSNHGYDVADFSKISEERGGEKQFSRLMSAAEREGLGVLLDIVPNHMGIAGYNPYWIDILAHGKNSRYWTLFDLRLPKDNRISLPILGDDLEKLHEQGTIKLIKRDEIGYAWDISGRIIPINKAGQEILSSIAPEKTEGFYSISYRDIENILSSQYYILDHWTKVFEGLTYRRFFDVSDLIGVRVDDEDIFELAHKKLLELLKAHKAIDGVRVDHIDGLLDPTAYLERLRGEVDNIWVEKILTVPERLSEAWPTQGTTGYEFIRQLNALMIDAEDYRVIEDYWLNNIQGKWNNFEACVHDAKDQVLKELFSCELNRLVDLSVRDGTNAEDAEYFWRRLTVFFPRYRSYFGKEDFLLDDKKVIENCLKKAFPAEAASKIEPFVKSLLHPSTDLQKKLLREWQQLTGPVTAKGLEDTAHYRFTPLCAMNEVGCGPDGFGEEDFWDWMNGQAGRYPMNLLASTTHDTKRSEDVRARLYALSSNPQKWIEQFEKFFSLSADTRTKYSLEKDVLYFLFQNMAASLPVQGAQHDDFIKRMQDYMIKSVNERKTETSWVKPNEAYQKCVAGFVEDICNNKNFMAAMLQYVGELDQLGRYYSLACLTVKILGPGVPDIYQGCEEWNYSLVDPDNRRPVDFEENSNKLRDASPGLHPKIFLTERLLKIRRRFMTDDRRYNGIAMSKAALAFEIVSGDERFYVFCKLQNDQKNAELPFDGKYEELLSEQTMTQKELLAALDAFPVVVLRKI